MDTTNGPATIHHVEWTSAERVNLHAGAHATILARYMDDIERYDTIRVSVVEPTGRVRGPIDVHVDARDDNDNITSALSYALDGGAPGLARAEQRIIATKALQIIERACPECGEDIDVDCFGTARCPECDAPCPGCYSGPGPGEE